MYFKTQLGIERFLILKNFRLDAFYSVTKQYTVNGKHFFYVGKSKYKNDIRGTSKTRVLKGWKGYLRQRVRNKQLKTTRV